MSRIIEALLRPVNRAVIIILGAYTVLWGVWVANPYWDVFTRAPLYDELNHFGSEPFWGIIAMVCGGITIYGATKPSFRALCAGAVVAFFHWLMISVFYFVGDWQNTGGITSLTFSILAAYIFLNIKVNHQTGNIDTEDLFS